MSAKLQSKLHALQVGRAFAAQFVILFHIEFQLKSRFGLTLNSIFADAGHSGVEFFFVLSGFIMSLVHFKDIGCIDAAPRYFYNRIVRIYPVFLIVLFLTYICQLVAGQVESSFSNFSTVLWAIFLLPFDGSTPVAAAWTLSHELLFYLLLSALIINRIFGLFILSIWWTACAISLIFDNGIIYPFSFLMSPYNILFGFGIISAAIYHKADTRASLFLLFCGLLLFLITIFYETRLKIGYSSIMYGLGSMAIIGSSAKLEVVKQIKFSSLLIYLGDASYSTYLIHSLSIVAAAIFLDRAGLAHSLATWQITIIFFVTGNAAGIALYQYAERPLLRRMKLPIRT